MKYTIAFTFSFCASILSGQVTTHYDYLDTTITGRTKHYVFTKNQQSETIGTFQQTIYCDNCPDEGISANGTFRET